MPEPVRLTPSLREKIWGSKSLAPYFPPSETAIGEVWFLAGRHLPLLVKFLYTSERLSVQVHPADGEEGPNGKTEMWHVLHAEPGAALGLGFREPIARERLRDAALSGEIERLIHWMPVEAGETYFVPAHTVHAIGAGLVICEIQQHTDITYRLYDYGRPRELHLERAVPLCDLGVHPGRALPVALSDTRQELVRCAYFATERIALQAGARCVAAAEECQLWVVLEGCGNIAGHAFQPGEVWLMPPHETMVRATLSARFLRTYVPRR